MPSRETSADALRYLETVMESTDADMRRGAFNRVALYLKRWSPMQEACLEVVQSFSILAFGLRERPYVSEAQWREVLTDIEQARDDLAEYERVVQESLMEWRYREAAKKAGAPADAATGAPRPD